MQLITKDNDCALFLNADELHFVRFKSTSHTAVFIARLIGFILLLNGIVQLFISNQAIAAIFIPTGLAGLYLGQRLKAKNKSSESLKPTIDNTILIVDTCEKDIYSGKRIHLGHLSECSFSYSFQMTSSAKSLHFEGPQGKIFIVKGNPFGGSNKPFYNELKRFDLV